MQLTTCSNFFTGIGEINLPSRKTVGSEKGAEQILEALEVCKDYSVLLEEYRKKKLVSGKKKALKPAVPLLMTAYKTTTVEDFLIEILARIRSR